jgi:alpha-glucosidase
MSFSFVQVNDFTPNLGGWTPVGNIASWHQTGNTFNFNMAAGRALQVSFLGPLCFRVRFSPAPAPDYTQEHSFAVVSRQLGQVTLTVQDASDHVLIDTGQIQVRVDLEPYRIRVFRGGQLICADESSYNLVYIPGQQVIANFKTYPANARYCGFGEKAGATLFKNQDTNSQPSMTFFNFDNFSYSTGNIPAGQSGGPLNQTEPLYCSVPLLIEVNPDPVGDYAGNPYCYGIFFDNPSQSYFNLGVDGNTNMFGKYYFGALYGEMDYYFMAGDGCPDVLAQYTTLTGRSPMPPKYVFGFHQGGYGYFDRYVLAKVANSYRAAHIPIDGLHIDVDFQNNYRTFTHSEMKFPDVEEMMNDLHTIGFKCSTNITPMLTTQPLDENGQLAPYAQLDAMKASNSLLFDTKAGQGESPNLYVGTVSYGDNAGSNPYPYPPLKPNAQGVTPLGSNGNYSDYAHEGVAENWGNQYQHLIEDVGMDMIWQDMMCPAIANADFKTFPLDLMQDNGNGQFVPNANMHNVYGLTLLKATWEGIQRLRKPVKNQRNFIIARGGYAGMQRYAGLWTGDSPSSWDYLQIYIPQVLNQGLSGIPISGSDIGGFANGPIPSGTTAPNYVAYGKVFDGITNYELLTRWMHVGAFLPWYRNHYNGYTKQFQEAYAYGEPVPTNCRKYVELRYRLLQLFYDCMFEWTQTGMPICRPLFLNDPQDATAYNWVNSEFFVGHDFLVAPIVTQHITAQPPTPPVRQVYLPGPSQWYSFKDNGSTLDAPVDGGTLIPDWFAGLDQVPIYVRAGAILPMRVLEQWVGQLPQNPLTINIYPGPDSTYQLYQDDGITFDAQDNSAYRLTTISHQGINGGQNVRVQRIKDNYTPPEPFYYVTLLGTRHPSSVTLDGTALTDVANPANLAAAGTSAYYWNQDVEITFVKIFDTKADVTLTALYL